MTAAALGTNRRVNKTGTPIEDDVVAGVEKNVDVAAGVEKTVDVAAGVEKDVDVVAGVEKNVDVVAGVGKTVEIKEVIFLEMDVESIILSIRNKGENVCFGLKTTTMDVAIMIIDKATIHRVRS